MNFNKLETYLKDLENSFHEVKSDRRELISNVKDAIITQLKERNYSEIVFICTHNSRRSQISELFSHIAFRYYNLKQIKSYSGGTEVSSFFPYAVEACKSKGTCTIQKSGSIVNHTYLTVYKYHLPVIKQFSKRYDDKFNPQSEFIAIMVCGDADENCPFIPGVSDRLSLTYVDPKHADQKDNVKEVYEQKVDEIAREILFLAKQVKEAIT